MKLFGIKNIKDYLVVERDKPDLHYYEDYNYFWRYILATMFKEVSGVVLDIGTGRGQNARALMKHNCSEVVALDVGISWIEHATTNPIIASAEDMPFRDKVFDCGFCRATLHHIPTPETALSEIRRTIKDKTVFIEPGYERELGVIKRKIVNVLLPMFRRVFKEEPKYLMDQYKPPVSDSYTRERLTKIFHDFEVIKAEARYGFSRYCRGFKQKNRAVFWLMRPLDRFYKLNPYHWFIVVRDGNGKKTCGNIFKRA